MLRIDEWTLQEGNKERRKWGLGREVGRKQTTLLPSASLQSSQRARLEILKQGNKCLVSNGEEGQEGREQVLEMRLAEETFLWYQGVLLEEVTFQQVKPLKNEKESDLQEGCRDQARL